MSKYKPAIFQPTIRPDWGGVLSYLSTEEKAKILECILKYPLVDCDSPFWVDVIKPELDLQFDTFKEACKAKAKGGKSRWEKDKDNICITDVEDKDNICLPYGNLLKEKEKEKVKVKEESNIYISPRARGDDEEEFFKIDW